MKSCTSSIETPTSSEESPLFNHDNESNQIRNLRDTYGTKNIWTNVIFVLFLSIVASSFFQCSMIIFSAQAFQLHLVQPSYNFHQRHYVHKNHIHNSIFLPDKFEKAYCANRIPKSTRSANRNYHTSYNHYLSQTLLYSSSSSSSSTNNNSNNSNNLGNSGSNEAGRNIGDNKRNRPVNGAKELGASSIDSDTGSTEFDYLATTTTTSAMNGYNGGVFKKSSTLNGTTDLNNGNSIIGLETIENDTYSKSINNYYRNNDNEPSSFPKTAPEVNQWTTLMADGTNAAINYPSKEEISLQEGLSKLYQDLEDMTEFDEREVERYWDYLLPKLSYLGTSNLVQVKKALRVAYRAHRGQMRKSGEPFIIHPVEVSSLLSDLKMDTETIISGVLHDTVEDTNVTFTQVEAMFGEVVRSIVEGETKVSKLPKLEFSDYADEQAENLRQMFVAMSDDYRIIVVKLADRLHNMRTLKHMKPAKQIKISRETLDIFAPLAHRMGIWRFKSELEDTAFMYLHPQEHKRLHDKLNQHTAKFRETLEQTKFLLRKTLREDPTLREQAHVEVDGRTKDLYSLWLKMETKADHNFDHISDVVALRVILSPKIDEENKDGNFQKNGVNGLNGNNGNNGGQDDRDVKAVWLCYHALGLVQHLPGYQPVPTRVKDYISFPKPNGYQALHTELMLNGQTIEVQIRTAAMHQVAEKGMAAHWAYTDEKKRKLSPSNSSGNKPQITSSSPQSNNELYNTPWLSSIKEWQDDEVVSSRDFVECVRRELLGKRVFVFLRNGKILNLARGATVIDAAFQIHTEVGLAMHGVHINGKHVPFSYELQNGDVVSILTGEGKPALDWMRYAKSRSTRSKLRSYFRSKQRESLKEAGRILLLDFLTRHKDVIANTSFLETSIPTSIEEMSALLDESTRYQDMDELLIDIGKRHDWDFLRSVSSKLLKVPLSALIEAEDEQTQSLSKTVHAAVFENRQMAQYAARAINEHDVEDEKKVKNDDKQKDKLYTPGSTHESKMFDDTKENSNVEEVDFDHLCRDCLPMVGDEIVGTRQLTASDDMPATVHRSACKHAMRAINNTRALKSNSAMNIVNVNSEDKTTPERNNSNQNVSSNNIQTSIEERNRRARTRMRRRFTSRVNMQQHPDEIAVPLKWPDIYDAELSNQSFLAEVVVTSNDRKQLLADCGEIVSDIADIVKTASMTIDTIATFEYLVKVRSTDHLQELMDALRTLDSVMSVERRFGSKLL